MNVGNRAGLPRQTGKWMVLAVLLLTMWMLAMHLRSADTHEAAATATAVALPAQEPEPSGGTCQAMEHAEYYGDTVLAGNRNFQPSAGECCESCRRTQGCNVWVWCGRKDGCNDDGFGHCCLKHQQKLNLLNIDGKRHPGVPWTSGGNYTLEDLRTVQKVETARLEALARNESLPLVFMDVSIKGKPAGRIVFVLFTHEAPRAAENFRALCTGEKGKVPEGRSGSGQPYHFKGKSFYRIIHGFIDQMGADTESVFGGLFKDDPGGLLLKHDRKGLLSMANLGHDTNDSHFSIMMGPQPHLDGKHPIFGEVVSGFEVVQAINDLSIGKKDNTAGKEVEAVVTDSGQIRCGVPCGAPHLYSKPE